MTALIATWVGAALMGAGVGLLEVGVTQPSKRLGAVGLACLTAGMALAVAGDNGLIVVTIGGP